jgi:hypothetical protein
MKKRILVLLSVVALMALMMVVTVAPALAAPNGYTGYVCTLPDGSQLEYSFGQFKHGLKTGGFVFPDGTICEPQPRL